MNAILRTIRGERNLAATYWLWFFIPATVLAGVAWLGMQMLGPAGPYGQPERYLALVGVVAAIQLAITFLGGTGVIRSAIGRNGPLVWRVLAVAAALTGMLWVPLALSDIAGRALAGPPSAPHSATADASAAEQPELTAYQASRLAEARAVIPQRLNRVILEAADFDGTTLAYSYAVEASSSDGPDPVMLKRENLRQFCRYLEMLARPGELEALRFTYRFADGKIATTGVAASDCAPAPRRDAGAPNSSGNFLTDFSKETGIDL